MQRKMITSCSSRREMSLAAALIVVIGTCGCFDSGLELVPVKGMVTVNGKPLTKGNVITQPIAGRGSNGIIQSDGSFELSSGREAGAIPGPHAVAVVAYSKDGPLGAEGDPGDLIIPKRYTNLKTSELTIDVKDDDNAPVLELKSP
jgi:hypothetical protein